MNHRNIIGFTCEVFESPISYIYYADWCNSNIDGSWPKYLGANPKSANQGYSLIGKANCSW